MPQELPVALTYSFYGLIAWGLSALFVGFRILADGSVKMGLWLRAGLLVWLGLPAYLAVQGVFLDFESTPPQLMRVVFPMLIVIFAVGLSSWGKWAAERLPITFLVGLQIFRLPLEVVLYYLGEFGMISREMTLSGYNFDIVTGASALVLWILLYRKDVAASLVWGFNIMGTLLLVTVVTIAVLSFPAPFGWFSPPNLIVAFHPWAWLPTFLVPLALLGHLLLFRKLLLPPPPPRLNV